MDEQLKQRLIGATIIVALSVIFVPMLFEDKDHPAGPGVEDVPALPEAIEERSIELPKTAADVAQQEKKEEKSAEAETGYRVIPLNDAPKPAKGLKSAKAPKSAAEAHVSPSEPAESEAPMEEEFAAEDQEESPEKSGASVPKASLAGPARAARPARPAAKQAEAQEPEDTEINEEPPAAIENRKVPTASKSWAAKPVEPVAKKPEKPKAADSRFELPKPVEPAAVKSAGAKRVPAPEKPTVAEIPSPLKPASAKPSTAARTPPAETAQKPAGATGSWMVQAGSFSEEANAHALADKLRKRNLAAVVDVVPVGAGTMYRVRVGPELNRTRAEQIQKQIENAAGVKGIILPRK